MLFLFLIDPSGRSVILESVTSIWLTSERLSITKVNIFLINTIISLHSIWICRYSDLTVKTVTLYWTKKKKKKWWSWILLQNNIVYLQNLDSMYRTFPHISHSANKLSRWSSLHEVRGMVNGFQKNNKKKLSFTFSSNLKFLANPT